MSVFDKTKYPPLNLEHLLEDLDDRFESMSSRDGLDGFVGGRTGSRWFSRPELPPNVCRYFNQGFCKHGNRCRFLHEDPSGMLNLSGNEVMEHNASPQSLVVLELEIIELLKSQRGKPVSIASLPMLYYDKYKKTLQAEGYLTESQRHEKVGYNLTKLLARLKNNVRLIDRPNGQHSVILTEDVPKYMEYFCDKEDSGTAGLRQIYLTFPPHSTFTEKDVFDYFENFGPVQEVRIPWQEKRMFGFVTFVHPETVQQILSKDNPHHYVCGARILAKRYREKSRALYRKQSYKFQQQMDCQKIRILQACKMMRMIQIMEAQKLAIELEQISNVEAVYKHSSQSAYFGMGRIHSTQTHLEESKSSLLDVKDPILEDDNIPDNVDSVRSLNLPENLF